MNYGYPLMIIYNSFMDIKKKSFMDIHNWFMDIHKSFMDIINSFKDIQKSFMDIPYSLKDIQKSFVDILNSF